ncbi:TonB-dependent receptor [Sphingosinicella sp. BN140058]|uniref:TonB-dependent receptor n=1 Tax=Sphingosinicella sp. BN140058 TaxID=1892855 RepID=UPI001011B3E2|nr:TonB-dependent receptor [Sphingosinicella sp. BN140058]QAY77469.1 TonB-dependent receptor [Sphingosinicella sp. BN140058]
MKQRHNARTRTRRLGLCGGAALSALAFASAAQAQETSVEGDAQAATAEPSGDQGNAGGETEIIVTGIRGGLARSIDLKREETSIVEAISAEDIGKLPDVSIAESIARLPGLAAQRVNGRAQVISIRGLAPDFTTTLLNGRQQASSGDNRAVEFDQYPSELLGSVVIYKTPDAEISGMGLSGTADLRTVRPLDFEDRVIALNIRGEKTEGDRLNHDVRNWGGRASFSYIDRFLDGTLGVALGYAHLDSPSQNRHYKAYGYEAFGFAVTPDAADNALLLNGQEVFATSRLNRRDAGIAIVEWQPDETVHSTLDLYYSKFRQEETTRGAQWFSNGFADNATFTDVQTETRGGSMIATSGTLHNGVPILRNDYNTRNDEIFSAGLNNQFTLDPRTHFELDLSYSKNKRREQILETYAGYGRGIGGVTPATPDVGRTFDTIGFEGSEDGYPTYGPGLDYAEASRISLGDRAPWGGWGHDGAIRFPDVEESIGAIDAEIDHEMDGFLRKLSAGINWTHRSKAKRVDDFDLFLKSGRQQVFVDPRYLVDPTNLAWVGFGPVLSVDMSNALEAYYDRAPILDANYFDKNWDIQEDVVTTFVKADFRTGNLRGNIGVQIVNQDQRSTGVVINGLEPGQPIVPVLRSAGAAYTDILPSLNVIWELGGGHRLRLAASKTMARPRMDEMRANVTPGFNALVCSGQPCTPGQTVNPWSASGGNPNLKPWRAKALDLAYEWYVDRTTYFAVAGFYKKLDTYIYQRSDLFNFSGIPLPTTASSIPAGIVISPIGQITLPANGDGGTIKGVEFSGAVDLGTIFDPLRGLGFIGSLSLTDSNLNPADNGQEVRIPGLSGTIYNITAYYERGGFQARISQRYRSAFKGEVVQLFATRGYTEILADKQVDAQIGYTFESGALEGLGILFQVNNLTDSPYRTRLGLDTGGTKTSDGTSLLETYEKYGRQFLLGFNYRF